ncbi:STAS-like domain-containing protein [Xanthobacter sp. YC-JY1]|uniref:STAS-like domain-containing protein n=1 Tax=Xanthobacter sp. YC-JY1 TaxID=2419844 RepID=UPI001F2B2435|nr:STAS-like domain-containing protein [Xanthobacter sp. YC-JY1]UJX47177.1 DUF4325 domain-containing protein [Xanthobacter sp. YC-JY1]
MVIRVVDFLPSADTAEQGAVLHNMLLDELKSGTTITVSFYHIQSATSSFVNAAFVDLLSHFGFDELKKRLRIVESSRQINEMIKSRLSFESDRVSRDVSRLHA